jgi:Tfp pilus assembly protein PilN
MTALVVLVSLVALIFIVRTTVQTNAKADAVQRDINTLSQQQQSLKKQIEEVKNSLTPEQFQILKSAHELVDRKRFSWSRLFADLEGALPGGVRVTRINVRDVAARGDRTLAELDLTIVAKASSTVTDMIADMDRGGVFQAQLNVQNLQKGRGESGTEYELSVRYTPRADYPTSPEQRASVAVEKSAGDSKGGPR